MGGGGWRGGGGCVKIHTEGKGRAHANREGRKVRDGLKTRKKRKEKKNWGGGKEKRKIQI